MPRHAQSKSGHTDTALDAWVGPVLRPPTLGTEPKHARHQALLSPALTGIAQWVGCCPEDWKVTGSIPGFPGQGTRLGPQAMFPKHIGFPPFPSLSQN